MKNIDPSKIMYRSDQLLNAAPNRYKLVVQVANRAKRRHYEQNDSYYSDSPMKPVCRAIVEMAGEVGQADLIAEQDISTSDRQIATKSRSEFGVKTTTNTDKYGLFFLKNLAVPQAWKAMVGWINSSVCQVNLEAACISADRLIDRHPSKKPQQLAEIVFLHKSAQVAGIDMVRSIPQSEQIINVLSGWDLPTVAKLCTEMVFQIAYIYGEEKSLEEQKLQITSIFALASLNERAIDAKLGWLKYTGEPVAVLKGMTLTALSKALMIASIANSACIFYENQSLTAAGQTNILLSKAGYFLFGATDKNTLENALNIKLEQAKELVVES